MTATDPCRACPELVGKLERRRASWRLGEYQADPLASSPGLSPEMELAFAQAERPEADLNPRQEVWTGPLTLALKDESQ